MNWQSEKKPNGWQNRNRRVKTTPLSEWFKSARASLQAVNPDEPSSTLHSLVSFGLGKPTYFSLTHPDYPLDSSLLNRLNLLLYQLLEGMPLPYITGTQSFFGMDFFVNENVLIPRPETELLVSAALHFLESKNVSIIAADIGTGCGCIAVSLAKFYPGLKVFAGDISFNAILIAKKNAHYHQMQKCIAFWVGNLLDGIEQEFDCICANLPYIPTQRLKRLPVSQHEPRVALDGGVDGFRIIDKLLKQAASRLKPDGGIFLEIDHNHATQVTQAAQKYFHASSVKIKNDYAMRNRMAIIINKQI